MFAVIKASYTDVESFVYFNGVSTQAFPLYQGSGQGPILAPFMFKVYINRLIETVCNSKYSLVIDNLGFYCMRSIQSKIDCKVNIRRAYIIWII